MDNEKELQPLFDEYIQECEFSTRLRTETIKGYKAVFALFQRVMPEVTHVNFLTTEMLTMFFKRLQTRKRVQGTGVVRSGVKNSTIRTYWSKLNSFFRWLCNKHIIHTNPLSNIRLPEISYEDDRTLSDEDIHKLYASVTLYAQSTLILRRNTVMLSLLLFCGVRLGEFISLEVRDVDFEERLLTVRGQTSKSKKTRLIPIHPTLLLHLKNYIKERNKNKYTTQYLIVSTNSDNGLTRHGLKHWVKCIGNRSGVNFHLHRFRHTFASNLARKDVNAVKIQKLLGHGSLNMTMTYLRSISSEDLKDDINRLSI